MAEQTMPSLQECRECAAARAQASQVNIAWRCLEHGVQTWDFMGEIERLRATLSAVHAEVLALRAENERFRAAHSWAMRQRLAEKD